MPMHDATVPEQDLVACGASASDPNQHLFGPWADFLLLGGGSIVVLALVALLFGSAATGLTAVLMLLLANLVNHPHFAHSYQIFYRGYRSKILDAQLPRTLRLRYLVAGVLVPIAIAVLFLYCLVREDVTLLGLSVNAMAFLVGWHYVKQGYGMLMVDAAKKKRYFSRAEKQLFLGNAFACWLLTWLWANRAVQAHEFQGLTYYTFAVPAALVTIAVVIAAVFGALVLHALYRKWRKGAALPWNGLVAYAASAYFWMVFARIHPLWLLVIPFFHSLQYLAVVWRFELNRLQARQRGRIGIVIFYLFGLVLGLLAFWSVPILLDRWVSYDRELFGSSLFVAMFWLFINVHHYFLDNVMWRRENPETRKFLFSA